MQFTNSVLAAFLLIATTALPAVHSFTYTAKTNNNLKCRTAAAAGRGAEALFLSPEDLTNYMAKAHEDKIRAIKEVEDKKNAQIQTLKGEVTALKESIPKESSVVLSSPPSSGMDLSSMTKEELTVKLLSYQQFMAKYIVEAQQQKMKAVQAAEAASAAKYEGKMKLLLSASSDTSTTSSSPPKLEGTSSLSSADTSLYDTRSANVAAAAKAGKSRWGDAEVAKFSGLDVGAVNGAAKESTATANGSSVSVPSPISLPGSALYNERNEKVAAAGKAGKSRWGDAEVKKATVDASKKPSLSSTPTTETPPPPAAAAPVAQAAVVVQTTPEIEAADHGLRHDGGVGGPSLAERVNLGQQLFTTGSDAAAAAASSAAPIAHVSAVPSTYDLRNAKIAAAAAAGKSRWGSMENSKAINLAAASNALSGSTTTSGGSSLAAGAAAAGAVAAERAPSPEVLQEVEAADHGLRNDGGVGGPSLLERVNLGSGLY